MGVSLSAYLLRPLRGGPCDFLISWRQRKDSEIYFFLIMSYKMRFL